MEDVDFSKTFNRNAKPLLFHNKYRQKHTCNAVENGESSIFVLLDRIFLKFKRYTQIHMKISKEKRRRRGRRRRKKRTAEIRVSFFLFSCLPGKMRRLHSFWMRSHMQTAYRDKYELTRFSAYLSLSFVNFYMHFILFVWHVHLECSCMRCNSVAVDIISYTQDTTAECLDTSKDISRTYYVWKATLTNQLSIQQTYTLTHTTLSALAFFIIHIVVSFGRTKIIACGRKVS